MSSSCKSCRAEIVWVLTEGGKRMPVDAEDGWPIAYDDGNLLPTGEVKSTDRGSAQVVRVTPAGEVSLFADLTEQRWKSHFATCPDADQHRKVR